ncbi:putative sporulation protein YtxC [Cytobacillus purgationiresistens]|uniref:Sporulation protein YtxC n=1 Tax=Cytobacillus purgationiresistens TaxID=863449 RepID=A0ABU0AFN6_9BACI|nr:putative sporulation protein YtxC [Cytobacillus purgationiresistens]MDQ0270073.1 putative sporulation protein YtxC [Cytobacillus purgationiresistens]
MIEIIFQNREDAEGLYHHLLEKLPSSDFEKNLLQMEDQHIVKIVIEKNAESIISKIKEVFYTFIINSKRDAWFRRIMEDNFYYDDEDEQLQILEIIHSILEGEREDLTPFVSDVDVQGELKRTIDRMVENHLSFSFDSFVKFRMRPLMEQLTKFVEISIDEYKMEQEYQMFIQTLRDFLMRRSGKLGRIHLMIDEGVEFYDEQYNRISRSELTMMMDRKLLFNHPVYVDSVTIAPLLSIAPSQIYLYTAEIEQPLVRTIRNIFEERLILQAPEAFLVNKKCLPPTGANQNVADTP